MVRTPPRYVYRTFNIRLLVSNDYLVVKLEFFFFKTLT